MMPRATRGAARVCTVLLLAVLAACGGGGGGGGGTGTDNRVTQVVVTGGSPSLEAGATVQLSAVARTASGTPAGGTFTWTSSNSAIATVVADGQVLGRAPGTAVITATETGSRVAGAADVTVVPARVVSVNVDPLTSQMVVGQTQQMTARLRDRRGEFLTGRTIAWSTSDPAIATVNDAGLVTATGPGGPVAIRATVDGEFGAGSIVVTAVPIATLAITPAGPFTLVQGTTLTLNAIARDAQGNALTGRALSWRSSNPIVAQVSATGVVNAAQAGETTITATSEGVSASVQMTVTLVPVASVLVTGAAETVVQGGTVQFAALARDAQGGEIIGRPTTWTTSDPVIATVSANGLVSARYPGTVTVNATVGGRTGSAPLTVAPRTAASVAVSPVFLTLGLNDTRSLSVTAADAGGVAIPSPSVTWGTLNAAVASVTSSGVVRGESIGVTRVTARVDAATDTSFIAVLGPGSLLSTAFLRGEIRANLVPGSLVTVPVTLDMSRAGSTGDLGAAQFELRYDPTLLQYESAQTNVSGSGETHSPAPGTVRFAFAGTQPQGRTDLTLATLTFRVLPSAPVGAYSTFVLNYTAVPVSTSFQSYTTPVSVWGRMRIVAP